MYSALISSFLPRKPLYFNEAASEARGPGWTRSAGSIHGAATKAAAWHRPRASCNRAAVATGLGLNFFGGIAAYRVLLPRGMGPVAGVALALPLHLLGNCLAQGQRLNPPDAGPARRALKLTAWAACELAAGVTCVLSFPAFAVGGISTLVAATLLGAGAAPVSYLVGSWAGETMEPFSREAATRRAAAFLRSAHRFELLRKVALAGVILGLAPSTAVMGSVSTLLLAVDATVQSACRGCLLGIHAGSVNYGDRIETSAGAGLLPWSPTRLTSELSHLARLPAGMAAQVSATDWRSVGTRLARALGR